MGHIWITGSFLVGSSYPSPPCSLIWLINVIVMSFLTDVGYYELLVLCTLVSLQINSSRRFHYGLSVHNDEIMVKLEVKEP